MNKIPIGIAAALISISSGCSGGQIQDDHSAARAHHITPFCDKTYPDVEWDPNTAKTEEIVKLVSLADALSEPTRRHTFDECKRLRSPLAKGTIALRIWTDNNGTVVEMCVDPVRNTYNRGDSGRLRG